MPVIRKSVESTPSVVGRWHSKFTNPVLKESLMDTAQRWSRLAADLKAMHVLLEEWRQEDSTDAKKAG